MVYFVYRYIVTRSLKIVFSHQYTHAKWISHHWMREIKSEYIFSKNYIPTSIIIYSLWILYIFAYVAMDA